MEKLLTTPPFFTTMSFVPFCTASPNLLEPQLLQKTTFDSHTYLLPSRKLLGVISYSG